MIDDAIVVDAVAHGYNFAPENALAGDLSTQLGETLYQAIHRGYSPRGDERYVLDQHTFFRGNDVDLLGSALFAESQTDVAVYHGVPAYGMFADGGSPMNVGVGMRERWPGRVALYAPVAPWAPDASEQVDRAVEEYDAVGLKLYPMDIVDGKTTSFRMDDPEVAFPVFERAQARGIKVVAIHKAVPLGAVPMDPFRVSDVEGAALAFPDLMFEIVHGGFAFLEETVWQVARFPNVAVNLEGGGAYLVNAPYRFAQLLGAFLSVGGADRIIWATGCMALHPRPFVEAFWDFEMPRDLVEGHGLPPITVEDKRAILGGNIARIAGLDLTAMAEQAAGDEFGGFTADADLAEPWSRAPSRAAA